MQTRRLWVLLPAIVLLSAASQAKAGHHGPSCGPQVHYIEKTIMKSIWCTETRKVHCTAYRYEPREQTYTEYQCVPETKQVVRTCTVMKPVTKTKMVPYTVCKPVYRPVTKEYTVCVPTWVEKEVQYCVNVPVWTEKQVNYTVYEPHTETRQATRRVCKVVPETVYRQVQRDCGHWAVQQYQVPCGYCYDCNGCCVPQYRTVCRRVWVPKVVVENVPCTVYRNTYVDVPYTYCVTVCKPRVYTKTVRVCSYKQEMRSCKVRECAYKYETRQCTYNVCEYKTETHHRQVNYTVCVPHEQQYTENVTTYKQVPVEKKCTYQVCVPYTVEKEVQVQVCKMVPATIMVPICCGPCCCY